MSLGFYRDKTYCASPHCKNECGRKMSKEIKQILKADKYGRTSYAYFCGEPIQGMNNEHNRGSKPDS